MADNEKTQVTDDNEKDNRIFKKRYISIFIVLVVIVAGIYFLWDSTRYQSTDDAYVESHLVQIAPRVEGQIKEIRITDNQKVKEGDIIVADKNFGCGSSREHAPIAIKAAGVSCVIAKSFARIFYRNSINIGLPIIECEEAAEAIKAGDTVSINFDTGVITDETTGKSFQGQAFPPFMQKIIDSEGLINYINAQ